MDLPEVRYARSGDVNIAYAAVGDGPFDLVLVPGFISHLEVDWEEPRHAHFLGRLASFSRLILFDKRGTGLSDRPAGLPDLETRMDDVRAVMDAVGSARAALFGYSEGGPMSCLFAATYPDRTAALVLYGTYAKRSDPDADYPWAASWEERQRYAREVEREWGQESDLGTMAPSADEALTRWWRKRARAAASPGAARDLILMNSQIDVRHVLSSIHVQTLVLHRSGDRDSRADEGRYVAERIPGARFVELAGEDHAPFIGADQVVDEVEAFLTSRDPVREPNRVLATVLFTDIVGSTEKAVDLGDRAWAELLERHNVLIRRQLSRFQGTELDTAGDDSSRASTAPPGLSAAPWPSLVPFPRLVSPFAPACTRASVSSSKGRSAASQCTSAHVSPSRPGRAKWLCRRRSRTSSPGRASASASAALRRSRASRASGAFSEWSRSKARADEVESADPPVLDGADQMLLDDPPNITRPSDPKRVEDVYAIRDSVGAGANELELLGLPEPRGELRRGSVGA